MTARTLPRCRMPVTRPTSLSSHRLLAGAFLITGIVAAAFLYRQGVAQEFAEAEADFSNRALHRHALSREILGHTEDALFGLSALFQSGGKVEYPDFVRVTGGLQSRIEGVQAVEWVPAISQGERNAFEASLRLAYSPRDFSVTELGPDGKLRRAAERPVYYPIAFLLPVKGNEAALGYDLMLGPTRDVLESARSSRQMRVTPQFRLVQEASDQFGAVLIWPVSRPAAGATGEVFAGFLQCVFRISDLLETMRSREPDTFLDMLFIDASESEPARRTLYHRPAVGAASNGAALEGEFRRGLHREYKLPFGQRDWRVLFRPYSGWVESQRSSVPLARSSSILMLAGLLAGLAEIAGRRADSIRRQVAKRTAELAESRRQMAHMLEVLPGMSFRCAYDEHLTVLFVSEGALGLTGWTAAEFLSGRVHFRDCIHPDDLHRVREITRSALQDRRAFEVEYRVLMKSGTERWVLSRGKGDTGPDSQVLVEGLAIDISAQKNAESARLALERKMLEGQKLESLGLLAGGLAHDFNNLLSAILGSASMARISLPENDPLESQLRTIETASLRAAELCRQMLAYAGKSQFVTEEANLSALVEDTLPLLQGSLGRQANLRFQLVRELSPARVDATQIRQIIINLVLNAADATRERGSEITLSTGMMEADLALLAGCSAGAGLPPGRYVYLEVGDNGVGMSPDVLAKIFDPFFTTKHSARGLGLAAVLGIVRGHRGAIWVQSAPSAGARFRILLPPARKAAGMVRPSELTSLRLRHEPVQVLLVEDEEQVRTVTLEMMKLFGYTVTAVPDGHAAVAAYRENPGRFDVVLLDLIMPGLSGEETLATLRILNPDVRVLLMSGYGEADLLRRLGGGPTLGFLAKPFSRETLESGLRRLVG